MKLQRPQVRKVSVQVFEVRDNKMVNGTSRRMMVYEATSDEVFSIVRRALELEAGETADEEEEGDDGA